MVAVFARRKGRDERLVEVVGQFEVAVALVLLERPAEPDRAPVLVEVTDLCGLEFADTWAALADHEQRPGLTLSPSRGCLGGQQMQ